MSLKKKSFNQLLGARNLGPLVDADKSLLFGINKIYLPEFNGDINHRVSTVGNGSHSWYNSFLFLSSWDKVLVANLCKWALLKILVWCFITMSLRSFAVSGKPSFERFNKRTSQNSQIIRETIFTVESNL